MWVNFVDNYWVSDEGDFERRYKNGKIKKLTVAQKNTNRHILIVKIHTKECNARRIVWQAFKGSIPEGYIVRNKHGYKTMCDIYNLECVPKVKAQRIGGYSMGKKVRDIDNRKIYRSARQASKYLYMSRQTITDICNGRTKKPALNLEWYIEEY